MHDDSDELNVFFDAARRAGDDELPVDFLTRIEISALGVQAEQQMAQGNIFAQGSRKTMAGVSAAPPLGIGSHSAARRRFGILGQMLAAIGGWPAMAGLATAGVAGLWIGIAPPAALADVAGTLTQGVAGFAANSASDDLYLVDPVPGFALALDLMEGS